jgi:hypothetical protein
MQARQRFLATIGQSARLMALALILALAWPAQASAQTFTPFTFTATDSGSGTFSYGVLQAVDKGEGIFIAVTGYLIVIRGANVGTYYYSAK